MHAVCCAMELLNSKNSMLYNLSTFERLHEMFFMCTRPQFFDHYLRVLLREERFMMVMVLLREER